MGLLWKENQRRKMTLEKVPLYWRKVTEKWLEEHPEG